eukprot:scaffold2722_cov233-Pinguiococcus_pyrenoidosus.AAC.4
METRAVQLWRGAVFEGLSSFAAPEFWRFEAWKQDLALSGEGGPHQTVSELTVRPNGPRLCRRIVPSVTRVLRISRISRLSRAFSALKAVSSEALPSQDAAPAELPRGAHGALAAPGQRWRDSAPAGPWSSGRWQGHADQLPPARDVWRRRGAKAAGPARVQDAQRTDGGAEHGVFRVPHRDVSQRRRQLRPLCDSGHHQGGGEPHQLALDRPGGKGERGQRRGRHGPRRRRQEIQQQTALQSGTAHGSGPTVQVRLTSCQAGEPRDKAQEIDGKRALCRQAQAALRRTMEKYSSSCRLILCGSSLSKVIEPVRSRCLKLRVPLPQHEQVCDVLAAICRKKRLDLPPEFARSLSEHSNRNLRRAILLLEAAYVQSYPFSRDQAVTPLDWEAHIAILAKELSREQTPAKLLRARQMLYELLTNCIPGDVILDKLTQELLKNLDAQLKPEITRWAAFYAHRIAMGSKEIFHLEAFVAKYMAVYKKYINDMFGGDF